MVHTNFGENPDPFSSFFKSRRQISSIKKNKKLRNSQQGCSARAEGEQELEFCEDLW